MGKKNIFRYRIHGERCVYCGEPSNSDEHFPPKSVSDTGLLLPACLECNTIASAVHANNWINRVSYVKEKLRRQWLRDLKVANWSKDELDELGPQMRREVEASIKRKKLIQERLCWEPSRYLRIIATWPPDAEALASYGVLLPGDGRKSKTKERP